jgi:hypothetical protein
VPNTLGTHARYDSVDIIHVEDNATDAQRIHRRIQRAQT